MRKEHFMMLFEFKTDNFNENGAFSNRNNLLILVNISYGGLKHLDVTN